VPLDVINSKISSLSVEYFILGCYGLSFWRRWRYDNIKTNYFDPKAVLILDSYGPAFWLRWRYDKIKTNYFDPKAVLIVGSWRTEPETTCFNTTGQFRFSSDAGKNFTTHSSILALNHI
jgi:hypothetical protein